MSGIAFLSTGLFVGSLVGFIVAKLFLQSNLIGLFSDEYINRLSSDIKEERQKSESLHREISAKDAAIASQNVKMHQLKNELIDREADIINIKKKFESQAEESKTKSPNLHSKEHVIVVKNETNVIDYNN